MSRPSTSVRRASPDTRQREPGAASAGDRCHGLSLESDARPRSGHASLHDRPRLSAGHVTGHHRILVIRLVTSTCAGREWIGARNQLKYPFALEYPFALADALAYKFGYRRADPATTVAQHAASLTASASRYATSTRPSGPAGPAQRRAACLPGRWTTGHLGRVGVPAEDERRAPGDLPGRSNRGSSVRSAADSITEIRRCRLTLPYSSLPFIPANQPGRRRAVRTATPRQLMLPSARTSDR